MSLNIASAFRLRNKLKERIKELSKSCERASATKPLGTEENTVNFDGKNFSESIAAVSLLMATLKDFNLAIEKANAVNREDLITLETLKAELAFYYTIVNKVRFTQKYEYEYNTAGSRDRVEQELVLDQRKLINHYNELKKKKDGLEEKLANSNFSNKVEFDPEVINRLL